LEDIDEIEELGYAIGIPDILNLNPKRVQRIIDIKNKERISNFNENMGFAWEIGRLVGLAVNSPKHYPKRPTSYKEQTKEPETREEYLAQWRAFVEQNRVN
jgi:hypothetical protein